MSWKIALAALLAFAAAPAVAYIGPGAGLSFLGSLLTWVVGILIALGAILFYPIRILIRRFRGKRPEHEENAEPAPSDSAQ